MFHHKYWSWDGTISKEICTGVITEAEEKGFVPSAVGVTANPTFDTKIRNNEVTWLARYHTVECIIAHHARQALAQAKWFLDVTSVNEFVQIAKYSGDNKDKQFYKIHNDTCPTGDGQWRKITAVLLLSDPVDYLGGELVIEDEKVKTNKQGSIIVFPSHLAHQVRPVKKGIRYSATCWISGPPLK